MFKNYIYICTVMIFMYNKGLYLRKKNFNINIMTPYTVYTTQNTKRTLLFDK